jgi:hypothetical protein
MNEDTKNLLWSYGWSKDQRKAYIVDAAGYTVFGAVFTQKCAVELCARHNRAVRRAYDEGFEEARAATAAITGSCATKAHELV